MIKDKALRKTAKGASTTREAQQSKLKTGTRRHHDTNVDQILGSAASLFAEKSFGLASIREIAARGQHLLSAHLLLPAQQGGTALPDRQARNAAPVSLLSEAVKDVTDPAEKLRIFIENHVMLSTGNTAETKVAVQDTSKLSEPFLSEIRALERQYSQIFRALLVEVAQARGKELDRDRSRVLTSLFFGALNSIPTWYDHARDAGRRQQIAAETLSPVCKRGVASGSAHSPLRKVRRVTPGTELRRPASKSRPGSILLDHLDAAGVVVD